MKKRMFFMLLVVFAFLAVIGGFKFFQIKAAIAQGSSYQPPPEAVTTTIATAAQWDSTMKAIGSVAAVNGVTVSADLPGVVSQIAFDSGRTVSKGWINEDGAAGQIDVLAHYKLFGDRLDNKTLFTGRYNITNGGSDRIGFFRDLTTPRHQDQVTGLQSANFTAVTACAWNASAMRSTIRPNTFQRKCARIGKRATRLHCMRNF